MTYRVLESTEKVRKIGSERVILVTVVFSFSFWNKYMIVHAVPVSGARHDAHTYS